MNRLNRSAVLIFLSLFVGLGSLAWASEDARFALVIGNAAYDGDAALANPANDANDMAAALTSIGWKVTKVIDGDRKTMNRAVALCRRAKEMFVRAGIRVVRIGLQPSLSLEQELLAGPYHPAFGELVAARDWFRRIRALLAGCPAGSRLTVTLAEQDLSAFLGPKRINMQRLAQLGLADRLLLKTEKEMQRGTLRYVVG